MRADRVTVPTERGAGGWFYCLGCGAGIGREPSYPPHTVLDCLRDIRRWITTLHTTEEESE